MKYLLDTNTCVQLLRNRPGSLVAGRLAAANPGDVVLCSMVLGELLLGALRSRDAAKNTAEVQVFVKGFRSLDFGDDSAAEYAMIKADLAVKGTPIGPNDLLIAAIARASSLTLVTHNTAEFSRVVGLKLADWQI